MKLTLHEVAKIVDAQNNVSDLDDVPLHYIEFDSRKITKGDLFLPLKGQRDGHEFIDLAFQNGAVATFSEKELPGKPHLLVEDCLKAFQKLAHCYIDKMRVDVIAVTGSNGKTSTKDMIGAVLSTTYKTYKTQGNYNNEIGLPYTVLHMPDDTEKIVLEMGQDHMGDIRLLSEIARPRIAVLTLVGEAHLEYFGSRDKIAQGKMQIVDGMNSDGILIAPGDPIIDPYLPENQMVIRFGNQQEIDVTGIQEDKDSLTFTTNVLATPVSLPLPGKYNATNAMVAAYVGKLLAVTDEDIIAALQTVTLTGNRTEWKKAANGADILSDVYNANPTAMRLILETFANIAKNPGGKKIAVLADMKELGKDSVILHSQLIDSLTSGNIDQLVFYGDHIKELARLASQVYPAEQVHYFLKTEQEDQFEAMAQYVQNILNPFDQILLKGSHSMSLEKLVDRLVTDKNCDSYQP
ncbi:TPA: UDP-N-acetylmuramoyl-tripeptide--D-alanyl-D-alanine ligase [Streptococcus pyogenes]|uniref:UDP-N-acetylmuramoyl-tripeptide--D-alanyl-D- alanine ligase n=1 Tax=Streptococcus pyogenes TaxID=1314 RepID=UPI00109BED8E|nr:UDP-N-acetylmuramoyl-tripeptide--D-alanyl-D-alanine ligase [Streptococcus pyogenes]VGS77432.1 UDP-N-acetylmuramoyl-tripeptide--D-alanyl-D-alanine ligase [Streptococcus pyogenes]VGT26398.1 UDP-N-acetylmuramoyl-tripeptide--D-alanyl-D-alanine ligase [Streptococcus pyogenes]VGU73994.1 UDP-N-acetylmuramoyl-tripeptide--D-alanyl-D-alanine ligase [Streptococcus pyogenes]VHK72268.1 UDP-N-acetylmuramoyl-tripeptide--D-alanyl-D-alanine ligase [Streptococcus pyogenes]VHM50613.1 UDP-N-acetylmuramoyl-trip